jgi:two-component system osmolarity sensor histidine kinase EnvZ
VVLLQSVVAYTFMERHWQLVTRRLSSAVTADIAALIDIYESYPQDRNAATLSRIAAERLKLDVDILQDAELPPAGPKPFFSILDQALTDELSRQISRPYWTDTVGRSSFIEIRVKLDNGVMRVIARRSQAYASNSHIFLVWMMVSSLVLLGVAVLFLRNQIRPILRLADAAESFGKGRDVDFRPRGAREVRQAGHAFIEMKRRVERTIEQRTTMLNGVSHDLRTILTRFRLSLALLPQTPEVEDLKRDVDEMGRMLEGYLAFARGDTGEPAVTTDLRALLEELQSDAERQGHATSLDIVGDPMITVRPDAFRRLLFNLVANAARHGDRIAISANHETRWLVVHVDDDGPGIAPEHREEVFKPFVRLDEARNQDEGGSGLGLAIARDIARTHGGDIVLGDSPLGGLRATVRLPA